MPICDVCGKKVGFFDLYRLADGKCCPNCKGFALSHESTVSDIKQGLIKKENRKIIISRLESFFISEYEKLGLKFTRDGSDIKNAIKIDHIGSKYITFYNNTLYFIQGWNAVFRHGQSHRVPQNDFSLLRVSDLLLQGQTQCSRPIQNLLQILRHRLL